MRYCLLVLAKLAVFCKKMNLSMLLQNLKIAAVVFVLRSMQDFTSAMFCWYCWLGEES